MVRAGSEYPIVSYDEYDEDEDDAGPSRNRKKQQPQEAIDYRLIVETVCQAFAALTQPATRSCFLPGTQSDTRRC